MNILHPPRKIYMKLRKAKQMHSLWWIHYSFISKRSQWKQLSKLISLWRKLIEDEFGKWESLPVTYSTARWRLLNFQSGESRTHQCFSSSFPTFPTKLFLVLYYPLHCLNLSFVSSREIGQEDPLLPWTPHWLLWKSAFMKIKVEESDVFMPRFSILVK